MRINGALDVADNVLAAFCRKWKITEFALFGSVLRKDFSQDSDVDVLVTFETDAHWSLLDIVDIQEELKSIFGREVDVVERAAVEESANPFRRRAILKDARVVYSVA